MISYPTVVGTLSLCLISTLTHASPLQPRDYVSRNIHPRQVADYTPKGCYTEATKGRALSGNAYFDDLMTVEKCAAACSKFTLLGLEYGRECFCGNSFNEGSVPAPEEQCSFKCPGNPDEKCGAGRRLNVYERLVTAPVVTTPAPSTYQPEGCYTEATNGRALSGKTYYDDAMTTAKCASACAGFDLFGLEYYRECYCGNKLQAGSVAAPSAECKYPCTGDKNEICGGDNRLNLYTFGTGITVTPPVPTPKGYSFDGCFTEATTGRALTGSVYYDDSMTVEKCSAVCKGFTLFGLEYGRECFCGNTLQAGSEMVMESECNFPCPGNDAESCGAGNRLDVYHYGAATTTATTISSSSATTSSTAASSSAASSSSMMTSSQTSTTSSQSETTTSSVNIPITTTEVPTTSTTLTSSISMVSTSSATSSSTSATDTPSDALPTSTSSTLSSTSTMSSATTTATSSSIPSTTSSMPSTTTSSTTTSSPTTSSTTTSSSSSSTTPSTSSTITSTSSTTPSTTSQSTTSSMSTSSVCIPSPTQAIINPSFEQDLDGSGKFTRPWTFTGIGSNSVQSNTNNVYQSYDGTHFAVLYGRSNTVGTLSQTVNNLIPGKTYTFRYFYRVYKVGLAQQLQCTLSVQIRGQTVDSFTSPALSTQTYLSRSVTYLNPFPDPAGLSFVLTCPRSSGGAPSANFVFDAITLSTEGDGCS